MAQFDAAYANSLYKSKNHHAFMEYCLSFPQIEDADILNSMGFCYRDGKGVEKDLDLSIAAFKASAQRGDSDSMFRLGYLYKNNDHVYDLNQAIFWYTMAAENGCDTAMYNLGLNYKNTDEIKDLEKALFWFKKAVEHGHDDASRMIGRIYHKEETVKDLDMAVFWYTKAAEKGDSTAMYYLARLYRFNKEPRNMELSIYWYERAANAGDVDAMSELGDIYKKIKSCKDEVKMLYWYNLAIEKGNKDAKFELADYTLGKEPENEDAYKALLECAQEKHEDSFELLKKQAESSNSIAQFYLGRYYFTQNNEETAFEWYTKSAFQGYIPAQNAILIKNTAFTSRTVQDIKIETSTIAETTASNSRKLDFITDRLFSMNQSIDRIRQHTFTGNPETEEHEESIALQQSAAVINETLLESSNEKIVTQKTELMQSLGLDVWDRLLPESRVSLLSSAVLLKECEKMPEDFDFSGICITTIVALEQELKRIFFVDYGRFLKENCNPKEWPTVFIDRSKDFTLGSIFKLFEYNARYGKMYANQSPDQMIAYLKTIVKEPYSENPLDAFVRNNDPSCIIERCNKINSKYRIQAAHKGRISRKDATDCCCEICGSTMTRQSAQQHSNSVIGILRDMYSLLK